ncbi:hypothetical protein MCOR28_009279 [Pyricularia oryzae]|uniref:Metallo-beta-lactamase domain-containing protein n=1 Tax=Pyricularia grisea TaxID=148305 RepID=A0ABQ8N6E3_PYRGI|nr:hypothetical protein MCOR33_010207 [Pyricularia grisea]KAI6336223.1 hypothetical protein MCOR28_009279 [Pyricularia oryzae]KAI6483451.1 hypothetical protein MCOR11_010554 [Pyricularia oryzae]
MNRDNIRLDGMMVLSKIWMEFDSTLVIGSISGWPEEPDMREFSNKCSKLYGQIFDIFDAGGIVKIKHRENQPGQQQHDRIGRSPCTFLCFFQWKTFTMRMFVALRSRQRCRSNPLFRSHRRAEDSGCGGKRMCNDGAGSHLPGNAGQVYHLLASGQQSDGFVRPAGSFDGVYFVGQSWVSVWVFDIGDGDNGVVLVDALNNPGRRQGRGASGPGRVRVQGLRHQGRLISITHEHADHDGGLRYLQDTVGMPAYATKDAWRVL